MIQVCRDTSDAVVLYYPQRLYLKSYAKLSISVQLPLHKVHGKAISNFELMEKLRKMVQPESFSTLKVSKLNSEVIRFDAELENRGKLEQVISRLEDRVVKLDDYPDSLKVKVCEAKSDFPSRHSWDQFFRESNDMDEMKPGERPDTVHLSYLPIRWFIHERDRNEDAPPSESIFRKVFDKFGEIRQVDIPAADPFRLQMKASMRGITIPTQDSGLYFEGYVQFSEYVGFVRCMDALRGQKLMRKKDDLSEWCAIKVVFDKTKHMTDAAVKRRAIVRERLAQRQNAKAEEEKLQNEKIAKREAKERMKHERVEREKLEKMREREERRKKKQLAKLVDQDNVDLDTAAAQEEWKLLKIQKKLQALRLMEELLKRIELRSTQNGSGPSERYYKSGDMSARQRILDRMRKQQEDLLDEQREKYRQALDGRIVIRSALETKKPKPRASSMSSMSSEEAPQPREPYKRIKTEKLSTPEREIEYKKALGIYGMVPPFGFGFPFPGVAPGFPYPQNAMFFPPPQGAYYPPPQEYTPRRPFRGRGRGRGRGRDRYHYYNDHDNHDHRSRSRGRSRDRSRSRRRSRSGSRRRSRTRSRSRRSRSRRTRSRSRSRHHTRSRSRSRRRSRSRSRRRTKSREKSPAPPPVNTPRAASVDSTKFVSPGTMRRRDRSKSWSMPKENDTAKSWPNSPKAT